MQERKISWKPAVAVLLILAAILLAIWAASPSAAWLKTSVEDSFRVGADPKPGISLYMANYDSASKGYKWSAPLEMTDMRPAQSFGTPLKDGDFSQKVNAKMGVIDQLDAGALDETNYTWFCIRVHEDEGLKFKDIKLEYAADPFQFFGSDWDAAGNPGIIHYMEKGTGLVGKNLTDLFADDRVIPKMMEVAAPTDLNAFLSDKAPADGAMPGVSAAKVGYVGRLGQAQPVPTEHPMTDGYYRASKVDTNGYYYIYFRIGPNLDAYYYIVDYLFMNMPCYLSFDGMTVSIDIRK